MTIIQAKDFFSELTVEPTGRCHRLQVSLKITYAAKRSLLKMCHLRNRLRIFLFSRKVMFRSQDIQVFVFLAIP